MLYKPDGFPYIECLYQLINGGIFKEYSYTVKEHSKYAPSSANRWLVCTKSLDYANLTIDAPDDPNKFSPAQIGSIIHEYCGLILGLLERFDYTNINLFGEHNLQRFTLSKFLEVMERLPRNKPLIDEFKSKYCKPKLIPVGKYPNIEINLTDDKYKAYLYYKNFFKPVLDCLYDAKIYLDMAFKLWFSSKSEKDAKVFIEERMEFKYGLFGTLDFAYYSPSRKRVVVMDLKTGNVLVKPKSYQLQIYLLLVKHRLQKEGLVYTSIISQRGRLLSYTFEEMELDALRDTKIIPIITNNQPREYKPSYKVCRYCPALKGCIYAKTKFRK